MMPYIIIGALLSAVGVALGAFGSHSLKTKLNPEQLIVYDIATRYLMYHALGILAIGILAYNVPESVVRIVHFFGYPRNFATTFWGLGTISRGWECSHSIRSEILLRY